MDLSKAIRTEDKDLLLLFKETEDNTVPASVMRLKGKLTKELANMEEKTILGIYRERNGTLEQISINDTYIKDNGREMFEMVKNNELIKGDAEMDNQRASQMQGEHLDYRTTNLENESITKNQQKNVLDAQEILQKLISSNKLTQWQKNPNYYFVKGVRKTAVKFEDGRLRISNRYTPKSEQEKIYVQDLIAGEDVSLKELRQSEMAVDTPGEKERTTIENLVYSKDITALDKHLKDGLKEYINSEQYKNYLDTVSKFHNYSRRNIEMILKQNPNATRIAGAGTWNKEFGRYINKGEKGLIIYRPNFVDKIDKDGNPVLDENGKVEKVINGYYPTKVFDVIQTNGKELPKVINDLEKNVDGYLDIYRAIKEIAGKDNIKINFVEKELMPNAYGLYNRSVNTINLQKGMSQGDTLSTLLHELTHAKYQGERTGDRLSEEYALRELHAESIAYITSKHLGLDTSNQSFSYLSTYMKDRKDFTDLDKVIDSIHNDAKDLIKKIDTTLEKIKSQGVTKGTKLKDKISKVQEHQKIKLQEKQGGEVEKKFPIQPAMS